MASATNVAPKELGRFRQRRRRSPPGRGVIQSVSGCTSASVRRCGDLRDWQTSSGRQTTPECAVIGTRGRRHGFRRRALSEIACPTIAPCPVSHRTDDVFGRHNHGCPLRYRSAGRPAGGWPWSSTTVYDVRRASPSFRSRPTRYPYVLFLEKRSLAPTRRPST